MATRQAVPEPGGDDLAALEHAITTLESQRLVLGDDVVDTALVPLQARRSVLSQRAEGEQRRLVTVVFADLVGFTEMSGWLDAEDTRSVVDAYFARWLAFVEDQGGVVEKFIGDAMMAVFGLRRSWEDDAQRAVRAALSMRGDLEDLNADLEQRYRVRLRMRVGIDTGEVVVSTLGDRGGAEFVVVGPTVNRASRLESAAPPNGVLVSSDTHRQIRGRFTMERREGLVLKGIDEPVVAFLVLSERPQVFQLDRSGGVAGIETTTVGREPEMRFLQERLGDVVEERRWRVVSIVGEAGVGKSRLLLDFDSWLAERTDPVWWFRGRASPTSTNRANALLRDVIANRLRIAESDSAEEVRAKLEAGFAVVSADPEAVRERVALVGAWLNFDVGPHPMPDPQVLRDRASEALAEYFVALSRTAPVVLLLEDLHWADDGSLRWLDAADAILASAPVLVVGTTRPAIFERRERWGEGLEQHVRLPLATLSRRESRQLLEQILAKVEDPPAELVDLVITSAEGNPFYLEELVTWLVDAGVITTDDSVWRVERELIGSVVVPSTLRGVLQARLDALSRSERALLQRASVVGRVFWDEAVRRLAEQEEAEVTGTLEELRRRGLVSERELSSFDSAREFLFKHALLRDVAYDGVLRSHRRRYHARTAVWLAEVTRRTGREDEYAALVAEHFDRAGDPAAGRWYHRAGVQAASVYALAETDRLLRRALVLVTDDPLLRFDVLAAHEAMLDRVGDRDAQEGDLDEMGQLLEHLEDPTRICHYQLARARLTFTLNAYDDSENWAEQAVSVAAEAGLLAETAEAHLMLGKSLTWHDQLDAARSQLHRARDEARDLGRQEIVAEALRYLSILANNEGDYLEALDLVRAARAAFAAAGDAEGEGTALGQTATTLYNLGRMDEARDALESTLPIFRRSGHRYREALVMGNLGTIAMSQGELAAAQSWASDSLDRMRQLSDREAAASCLIVLGMIDTAVGDWDRALTHLSEALALSREVESRVGEIDSLTKWAFLLLERGDPQAAAAMVEEAVEASALAVSAMEVGHAQLASAYAALATGATSTAGEMFLAARQSFASLDLQPMVREAGVGQAAVALAVGDRAGAAHGVEGVLEHLDRAGLEGSARPAWLLQTVVAVLEATGDPRAQTVREQARAVLEAAAERIGDARMAAGFRRVPTNAGLLGPGPDA